MKVFTKLTLQNVSRPRDFTGHDTTKRALKYFSQFTNRGIIIFLHV